MYLLPMSFYGGCHQRDSTHRHDFRQSDRIDPQVTEASVRVLRPTWSSSHCATNLTLIRKVQKIIFLLTIGRLPLQCGWPRGSSRERHRRHLGPATRGFCLPATWRAGRTSRSWLGGTGPSGCNVQPTCSGLKANINIQLLAGYFLGSNPRPSETLEVPVVLFHCPLRPVRTPLPQWQYGLKSLTYAELV